VLARREVARGQLDEVWPGHDGPPWKDAQSNVLTEYSK
jgi:hypothetical protein